MGKSNRVWLLLCLAGLLGFSSCGSVKDIAYLQSNDLVTRTIAADSVELYIQADDLLDITVKCLDEELSKPFNLQSNYSNWNTTSNESNLGLVGFLVDKGGYINYPVLGRLYVNGMTRLELVRLLETKLSAGGYIKDPIVTVQFRNFRITVLGEVSRPGTFRVGSERITLFQALGMAGDLTLYGRRDRVAVIREEAGGKRTILYHDLRSIDVMQSPFFYLKQNDMVYVEPNRVRGEVSSQNQFSSVGTWISLISFLTTMGVLIFK